MFPETGKAGMYVLEGLFNNIGFTYMYGQCGTCTVSEHIGNLYCKMANFTDYYIWVYLVISRPGLMVQGLCQVLVVEMYTVKHVFKGHHNIPQ